MTQAESSNMESNLVKTLPYYSDADMTDEEIIKGLMDIIYLSLSNLLADDPTYE